MCLLAWFVAHRKPSMKACWCFSCYYCYERIGNIDKWNVLNGRTQLWIITLRLDGTLFQIKGESSLLSTSFIIFKGWLVQVSRWFNFYAIYGLCIYNIKELDFIISSVLAAVGNSLPSLPQYFLLSTSLKWDNITFFLSRNTHYIESFGVYKSENNLNIFLIINTIKIYWPNWEIYSDIWVLILAYFQPLTSTFCR